LQGRGEERGGKEEGVHRYRLTSLFPQDGQKTLCQASADESVSDTLSFISTVVILIAIESEIIHLRTQPNFHEKNISLHYL
jgi:hypothetical protein